MLVSAVVQLASFVKFCEIADPFPGLPRFARNDGGSQRVLFIRRIYLQEDLVIDVKNLNKSFGTHKVVNDFYLQVKRGEIFGFLGPNGSGKTTSIRMICGLLTPDSAKGQVLGYDVLTQTDQIKAQVGYMTQRFSLYEDLSIFENLDFIARVYDIKNRKKRVQQSIAELGLIERQTQLAGELSGGWKQRLALAAALLHDPQLLLLDEPTAGVDPNARRQFWDHIHYLSTQKITTLVTTHYMDEAERCNRIAYLAYGSLLAYGTVSEVIAKVNLTTYKVIGKDLAALALRLKQANAVEQVISFGEALHVSDKDPQRLAQVVKNYQSDQTRWQLIDTNLEDTFIHLVGHAKDNYS